MRKWNLDFFAERFGDREVEVQMNRNSGDQAAQYEMNSERFTGRITFGEFIHKLRTAGVTNDFYLTANNNSSNRKILPELWDDIVQIPEYLALTNRGGFFWMGPAGTVTPFHHDLTNNFMAQVMGRKLMRIAPSWDIPLMRNHHHCFSQIDGRSRSAHTEPGLRGAADPRIRPPSGRDPLPADRLFALRPGAGCHGDRIVHEFPFRQRLLQFLLVLLPRMSGRFTPARKRIMQPEAPASELMVRAGIHSLALRARNMTVLLARVILVEELRPRFFRVRNPYAAQ